MILDIQAGERLVAIGSGTAKKFEGLFEIDSINVLIGKNGSGKTHLLLQFIDAITQGDFFSDAVRYDDPERRKPRRQGVIYFTSLPFRRAIARSKQFVDASKIRLDEAERMMTFHRVARDLNLPSKLHGQVSYSLDYVSKLVSTAILERGAEVTGSPHLAEIKHLVELQRRLSELQREEESQSTAEDGATDLSDEDLDEARQLSEQLSWLRAAYLKTVREHLERLPNHAAAFGHVVYLAALEHHARRSSKRSELARAFAAEFGLARFATSPDTLLVTETLNKTAQSVTDLLMSFDASVVENVARFTIDSEERYRAAKSVPPLVDFQWEGLSSGMQALVNQFVSLEGAIRTLAEKGFNRQLILLDEGDAYLHLDWQLRYIEMLNKFLGQQKRDYEIDCLQVTLATHSPVVASDLPGTMVHNLDADISQEKTFAAPIDQIIFEAFKSNTIGQFAAEVMRGIHERAQSHTLTDLDRAITAEIGDPMLRRALLGTQDRQGGWPKDSHGDEQ